MLDQVHMTSLFENATEGIILTSGNGTIVVANPATENMFGYMKDELINQPIEILIPDKFKSYHHQHREGFIKSLLTEQWAMAGTFLAEEEMGKNCL